MGGIEYDVLVIGLCHIGLLCNCVVGEIVIMTIAEKPAPLPLPELINHTYYGGSDEIEDDKSFDSRHELLDNRRDYPSEFMTRDYRRTMTDSENAPIADREKQLQGVVDPTHPFVSQKARITTSVEQEFQAICAQIDVLEQRKRALQIQIELDVHAGGQNKRHLLVRPNVAWRRAQQTAADRITAMNDKVVWQRAGESLPQGTPFLPLSRYVAAGLTSYTLTRVVQYANQQAKTHLPVHMYGGMKVLTPTDYEAWQKHEQKMAEGARRTKRGGGTPGYRKGHHSAKTSTSL